MSKLNKGRIPAHTECPFVDKCPHVGNLVAADNCKHQGKDHLIEFSCATARGFDIIEREQIEETFRRR